MKSEESIKGAIKEFEDMLNHVKNTESKEAYEVILKAYWPSIAKLKLKLTAIQNNPTIHARPN